MMINIALYCIYVICISFVFSFFFPLALRLMGKNIPHYADPVFVKIQVFIAALVLLLSLIFRKYLYTSCKDKKYLSAKNQKSSSNPTTTQAHNHQKTVKKTVKTPAKKTPAKAKKPVKKRASSQAKTKKEDDMKIYVEKEIK